ncbi:hypothetical protein Y1Q_0013743 [Alligator mississippiensis]|uniref:Uncharacterized protein n=1 Tax=Alligator mississippiensis TaxID=8496 RepID=A0A151MM24_ALLMI|nr:hypothetical protein Y1Q_0013743 [Alligator mississippiensis]
MDQARAAISNLTKLLLSPCQKLTKRGNWLLFKTPGAGAGHVPQQLLQTVLALALHGETKHQKTQLRSVTGISLLPRDPACELMRGPSFCQQLLGGLTGKSRQGGYVAA